MGRLTNTFGATSVLLATTAIAALTAGSHGNEGEQGASENGLSPSARIAEAFRIADAVSIEEIRIEKVRRAAGKADLLPIGSGCASQIWPSIAMECLAGPGIPSQPRVRTVTVEHRVGENTSILVRMPVQQAASQR